MRVDQIMLFQLAGSSTAGQYAAAARIAEAWLFIPAIVTATLAPAVLRKVGVSNSDYRILFSAVIYLSIFFAAPISMGAPHLVSILLGSQFESASPVLALLAFSGVFISIGKVTIRWCIAKNYTNFFLFRSVFGLSFNLLLNFIFIPIYGALGASLATLISLALTDVFILVLIPSLRPLFWIILESLNPKNLLQLPYLARDHHS